MEVKKISAGDRFSFKFAAFLFLIIIMLGALVYSFFNLSKQPQVKLDPAAPNFTLPGLDGKMISLTDYRGKVVLLNIWATWCPPCEEEMPSLEKLYKELKGEDFEILAVSIDKLGAKVVAPFMQKYKLSFPVLLNPEGTIKGLYGATGIPQSIIIDKEGIIKMIVKGSRDWATSEIIGFFRDLIQKPSPVK